MVLDADDKKLIRKLYYNPKTGFNVERVYRISKKERKGITMKVIRQFIKTQQLPARFAKPKDKAKRHYVAKRPDQQWEMDVCFIDLTSYSVSGTRVSGCYPHSSGDVKKMRKQHYSRRHAAPESTDHERIAWMQDQLLAAERRQRSAELHAQQQQQQQREHYGGDPHRGESPRCWGVGLARIVSVALRRARRCRRGHFGHTSRCNRGCEVAVYYSVASSGA